MTHLNLERIRCNRTENGTKVTAVASDKNNCTHHILLNTAVYNLAKHLYDGDELKQFFQKKINEPDKYYK